MAKRTRPMIGTHSGSFHCDEALGCALLLRTATFANAEIIRSRDPEAWKDVDILIDVGGEYNPARHRYDHHQAGFQEVFGYGHSIKLSSAGLVYKHFGEEVVTRAGGLEADTPAARAVWLRVYRDFVEAVDAVDNGIDQFASNAPPRYTDSTTLAARVGHLNPPWNVTHGAEELDAAFAAAVEVTGAEFDGAVRRAVEEWLPARALVERALDSGSEVHPSGSIIKLEKACPWKSHIYELEQERGAVGKTMFVLYADSRELTWRVQGVNVAPASFALRCGLPKGWRGLRGEELSAAAGVAGCVFAHASGFIGGNQTLEGAVAMAVAGLEEEAS